MVGEVCEGLPLDSTSHQPIDIATQNLPLQCGQLTRWAPRNTTTKRLSNTAEGRSHDFKDVPNDTGRNLDEGAQRLDTPKKRERLKDWQARHLHSLQNKISHMKQHATQSFKKAKREIELEK